MSSMSYCVIENTTSDLYTFRRVLNELVDDSEQINKDEQLHLKSAIEVMREIIATYESAIEDGVIDENGKLIHG